MKLLIIFAGLSLFATEPPKIPAEVEAEYYRADGLVAHIQQGLDQANADLKAAVEAVKKACGDKADPVPQGKHLVCAAKQPEPQKEAPKK